MSELKPCPFCGRNHGLLIESIHHRLDDVTVFCDASGDKIGCGASCGYYNSKKEAIEAWNRRAERREDG